MRILPLQEIRWWNAPADAKIISIRSIASGVPIIKVLSPSPTIQRTATQRNTTPTQHL